MWIFKGVGKQNLNIEYWKNEVKAAMEIKIRRVGGTMCGEDKSCWMLKKKFSPIYS